MRTFTTAATDHTPQAITVLDDDFNVIDITPGFTARAIFRGGNTPSLRHRRQFSFLAIHHDDLPDFDLSWTTKQIQGKISDKQCDSACTSARGHKCSCTCGGKNHGHDFLASR